MVIQDMPALRPLQSTTTSNCITETILPNDAQQQEFVRQLELLVNQLKSYPSIVTWVSKSTYQFTMIDIVTDEPSQSRLSTMRVGAS
jgi:hypothetical protein